MGKECEEMTHGDGLRTRRITIPICDCSRSHGYMTDVVRGDF